MTDSVFVFAPGERLTDDSTGAPISGATVYFYDAGTTNPKTIYADADLTASLGTSVVTDSLGYPIVAPDNTTRTLIYVGTAAYKIVIKDADGNTIATHDDIPGAVQSASQTDVSVTASFPVVTKSLAYTVVADDQNTRFAVNCSSADVTLTLPSAVTVGAGWAINVQHAGSANQVLLATVSSQTISEGSKSYSTQMALALDGEEIELTSDGGNWRITSHTSPFLKVAQGVLPITGRLSTPPVSPVQGALYILTSSPTGVWSSFSQHDVVQYHGGSTAWVRWTPPTDCGWLAYVQDEDKNYQFIGSAWVLESATDSFAGTIEIAIQSEMETATDVVRAVVPGRQQFHPSAAKVWGKAAVSAGVPALSVSYNMTSITDTADGDITCTIATDFSSANWACLATVETTSSSNGDRLVQIKNSGQTAGTVEFTTTTKNDSSNPSDPSAWHWTGLGDQ